MTTGCPRNADDHKRELARLRQQQREFGRHRPLHTQQPPGDGESHRLDRDKADEANQIVPTSFSNAAGSSVMPTVMKNSPSSRPLNGSRSISIW